MLGRFAPGICRAVGPGIGPSRRLRLPGPPGERRIRLRRIDFSESAANLLV